MFILNRATDSLSGYYHKNTPHRVNSTSALLKGNAKIRAGMRLLGVAAIGLPLSGVAISIILLLCSTGKLNIQGLNTIGSKLTTGGNVGLLIGSTVGLVVMGKIVQDTVKKSYVRAVYDNGQVWFEEAYIPGFFSFSVISSDGKQVYHRKYTRKSDFNSYLTKLNIATTTNNVATGVPYVPLPFDF